MLDLGRDLKEALRDGSQVPGEDKNTILERLVSNNESIIAFRCGSDGAESLRFIGTNQPDFVPEVERGMVGGRSTFVGLVGEEWHEEDSIL